MNSIARGILASSAPIVKPQQQGLHDEKIDLIRNRLRK